MTKHLQDFSDLDNTVEHAYTLVINDVDTSGYGEVVGEWDILDNYAPRTYYMTEYRAALTNELLRLDRSTTAWVRSDSLVELPWGVKNAQQLFDRTNKRFPEDEEYDFALMDDQL